MKPCLIRLQVGTNWFARGAHLALTVGRAPVGQDAADEGDGAEGSQEAQPGGHEDGRTDLHAPPRGCPAVARLVRDCAQAIPSTSKICNVAVTLSRHIMLLPSGAPHRAPLRPGTHYIKYDCLETSGPTATPCRAAARRWPSHCDCAWAGIHLLGFSCTGGALCHAGARQPSNGSLMRDFDRAVMKVGAD